MPLPAHEEDPDEETIFVMDPRELTRDDWLQIKKIAIRAHDNELFEKDQFKCAVHAYFTWAFLGGEKGEIENNLIH